MTAVLVTGSAGFVGGHLTLACQNLGWSVTGVDVRPAPVDVEAVTADAGDERLLARIRGGAFDAVLHQAGISNTLEDSRQVLHDANVALPVALARACAHSGTRFIFASSSSVYGTVHRRLPVPEDAVGDQEWCSGPLNEYGRSTLALEREMSDDLSCVGLRYTDVFGPGEQRKGAMASILSQMLRAAAASETISVFRDTLAARRDYVPISLLVDTVAALVTKPVPSGVYNLGSGCAVSFAEVLQWCATFHGDRPLKVRFAPNALGSCYQRWTCADMSRLRAVLPGMPQISREEVRGAAHALYRSFAPAALAG